MASEDFIESVEEMVAVHISSQAARMVARVTSGEINAVPDQEVEMVIYRAIRGALERAREQIAVPRVGSMTFEEAMDAVAEDKMVTRPGWGIFRALQGWPEGGSTGAFHHKGVEVMAWRLDNGDGLRSGSGSPYDPSDEDRAATDWMEYRRPEVDLWVDLYD